MSYFGVSLRNGVGLGLGTVPSLTNTPLSYRLAPALNLSFAGSDSLSPAITFSRTTNATLTNSAGLVAYAPTNLLTYSEQFDNAAWTKTGTTVTANTVASPTATTTADTLTATAGTSGKFVSGGATVQASASFVFSVYVKAGTWGFVQLLNDGDAQAFANFDVTTGVVGTAGTKTTASIVAQGNGWYRCTAVFNSTTTVGTGHRIYIAPSASATYGASLAAAGTETVQVWGAQLELGSTATTYNTTTVKNLLGYTENFDNAAWTKSNATITSGFTDIYGQPFAQKLVEDTTNNIHFVNQLAGVVGNVETRTIYAKAAERTWLYLGFGSGGSAYFDLVNGVLGTVSGVTATITAVGNGWFRCSVGGTRAGNLNNVTAPATANGVITYTGDGTSGIYIFGAQLSDSASVDPYVYQPVAAPSSTAYYGPRFDYGIPYSQNLLLYSEQFDNGWWAKQNATIAANSTSAPDGAATGDAIVESATTGSHGVVSSAVASTNIQTFSVYAKAGGRSWLWAYFDGYSAGSTWFDLSNGVLGQVESGVTATIKSVGGGWYRCTITKVNASSSIGAGVFSALSSGTTSYTGTAMPASIYVWGAQLEQNPAASEYQSTTVKNLLGYSQAFDNAAWTKSNSFVQANQLLWSEDFTNSSWIKAGATTAPSANTVNFPNLNDAISQGVTMTATVGASATFSVVLSGSGTLYVTCYRVGSTTYEEDKLKVTLTSTPTRYTVTHTMVNAGQTGFGGAITRGADGTATTVTATRAQLVQGAVPGDYRATTSTALPVLYADPVGVTGAEKLVEDTALNLHSIQQAVTAVLGTPYALSVYVKAGERSKIWIKFANGAPYSVFDLSAGTATSFAGATSSITAVGNGWYRCVSVQTPALTTDSFRVLLDNGSGVSYTGDGTSGVYVYGAQLSDSASVDPYVVNAGAAPASTAVTVTGAPVAKGLLIEEQRTNLVLNSSILNTQIVTVTAAAHTLSFYGTGTIVLSGAYTGTVTGTGAYPTRTTLTFTPIVGALTLTVTGSVTMAQLEAGAFATSYIPTVASQVTRAADSASMIGNNFARWYNATEGTLFTQAVPSEAPSTDAIVRFASAIYDSLSYTNAVRLERLSGSFRDVQTVGGSSVVATNAWTLGTTGKVAGAYANSNSGAVFNGGAVASLSGAVPTGITQLGIGGNGSSGNNWCGHIVRISYYNRRLSNTELQGITS